MRSAIRRAAVAAPLVDVTATNANMRAAEDRIALMENVADGCRVSLYYPSENETQAVLTCAGLEVLRSGVHTYYVNSVADLYQQWLALKTV